MSTIAEPGPGSSSSRDIAALAERARRLLARVAALAIKIWRFISPPPPPLVAPYVRERRGPLVMLQRALIVGFAIAFCFVYGAVFALYGRYLMVAMSGPLVILALLIIWALPATKRAPLRWVQALFLMVTFAPALWPVYIGVEIPGLPWFTLPRLIVVPLLICFGISLSTSSLIRSRMALTFKSDRPVFLLLMAYLGLCVLSIGFSSHVIESTNGLYNLALGGVLSFFVCAYLFEEKNFLTLWARLFWASAFFVALITLPEAKVGHVLWRSEIPRFLSIGDAAVQTSLAGGRRLYGWGYRAESTLGNAMVLGEYLALATPFAVHFALKERNRILRIAAWISLPVFAYAIFYTHARSGMAGLFVTGLLYLLYWGLRRWRSDRNSLIGPAVVFGYPAAALLTVLSIFFVHRISLLVLGGGAEQASNDSRKEQWAMGLPKVFQRPWGWGYDMNGYVVGFREPNGNLTIDSYILSVLVDLGFLGLAVFLALWFRAIWLAGRAAIAADQSDEELHLVAPVGMSLCVWMVIKTVLSETQNYSIAFIMLAAVMAVTTRRRAAAQAASPVAAATPAPRRVRLIGAGGMPAPARLGQG